MKKTLVNLALFFACTNANAGTINFDDLLGDLLPVANGYKGLNWNNQNPTGNILVDPFLTPGVDYTGIQNIVLFNAFGYQAPNTVSISPTNGGNFDFISGYWSAGTTGDVDIQFKGYKNNQLAFLSNIYSLSTSGVSFITLNWLGLDSLEIVSSDAVWIADNLNINLNGAEVPAPNAAWLFGTAILGYALRRRESA